MAFFVIKKKSEFFWKIFKKSLNLRPKKFQIIETVPNFTPKKKKKERKFFG